jgi:hypothetical protein
MKTTPTRITCSAYDAGRAIVIELEVPAGVEVDTEGLSISRMDGTLELRLPTVAAAEDAGEQTLRGFHPDAAPT